MMGKKKKRLQMMGLGLDIVFNMSSQSGEGGTGLPPSSGTSARYLIPILIL